MICGLFEFGIGFVTGPGNEVRDAGTEGAREENSVQEGARVLPSGIGSKREQEKQSHKPRREVGSRRGRRRDKATWGGEART
jgi:hypothetical protein